MLKHLFAVGLTEWEDHLASLSCHGSGWVLNIVTVPAAFGFRNQHRE